MTRRRVGHALIGLSVALAVCSPARPAAAAATCETGAQERAVVSAIGERLEIVLGDGRRIRLTGLDGPDSGRGDPDLAAKAHSFAADWLVGREVGVQVVATKPDRWGRIVAELSAASPASAPDAPPVSVSLALLRAGYGRVWPEPEVRSCLVDLLRAEAQARDDRLGVWRDPYYAVLDAADRQNLLAHDGQFAVIEGVALKVGEGRSRYYVDLALHRGFTIVIPKRRVKIFERAGISIPALTGIRIRVRGALDGRFGPRIEISEPDAIERLGEASETKGTAPVQ